MKKDYWNDYPQGILEKYFVNPLVNYILCPLFKRSLKTKLGIKVVRRTLEKILKEIASQE
ncbi:MAG: hypothetical protein ABH804_00215 [archaeon]